MLTITINRKPLSVNDAWQGRRFSTPAKKDYEAVMRLLLPNTPVTGPYYRVEYDFHLIRFATTDWDNLVKVTQDCLVKRGIITDDRHIIDARVRKYKAVTDKIIIRIRGCELSEA